MTDGRNICGPFIGGRSVRQQLFILTGPPASGKTTVAKALLQKFPFGIHIPVDEIREQWVVSGRAFAGDSFWTEETQRQVQLSCHAAARMACTYLEAAKRI